MSMAELRFEQMEILMPLLREALSAGQSVRFSPTGVSMLPMLRQGIDSVVLSPVTGILKKYDIPLYRRDNGKIVLHRVVETAATYTCMGDNQDIPERGIRHEQVLAVVTGFYRGKRYFSVKHPLYRCYCRIWCGMRYLRNLLK